MFFKGARKALFLFFKHFKAVPLRLIVPCLSAVFAVLASPHGVDAGWHLKIEQKCRSLPFQADGTVPIEQYISPPVGLTIMPDRKVILHVDSGIMYELDQTSKTYTQSNVKQSAPPSGKQAGTGVEAVTDFLQGALQTLTGPMRITPTDDYRQVVGFRSRRYDAGNLAVTSQIWATPEIKGYRELMAFGEKAARLFEAQALLQSLNIVGIISQIEGFPVYTTTWLLGGTMSFTVWSVQEQELDPELFKVPADYRLVQTPQ